MSGVVVTRELLASAVGVTALVPADRVVIGTLRIGTAIPAIAVMQISGTTLGSIKPAVTGNLVTERVQVTVFASSYLSKLSIIAAVRAALPNTHGTVKSISVDSILPDFDGPDVFDSELNLYEQSLDFIVRFVR